MKGYKGMEMNMTCRGMQYEVGKSYHIDDPVLCKRGFHFCKTLEGTFDYYNWFDNRFFEVEASGEIKCDDSSRKMVASDITILREIDKSFINRFVYSSYYSSNYGDGNSCGNGCGDGCGDGYGYGRGNGYGDGQCDGDGDGRGNGYQAGYGIGDGYGNSYGDGQSWGYRDDHIDITSNILEILNFK